MTAPIETLRRPVFLPPNFETILGDIFQPDLFFVSNVRKGIIGKFIYGAPDLVIETTSYGSKKKEIYGKYGVTEYWMIDPVN